MRKDSSSREHGGSESMVEQNGMSFPQSGTSHVKDVD